MREVRLLLFIGILLPILGLPIIVTAQDEAAAQTVHVIQPGETLFRIALQYGLSADELANANSIIDPTRIFAGQTLVIPGEVNIQAEAALVELAEPVQPIEAPDTADAATDTAVILPAQPGASGQLIEANTVITPIVAEAAPAVETRPIYHTITRGENLRSIAQVYGISEEELIQLNNITNPNRILAGQQLIVGEEAITPVAVAQAAPAANSATVIDPAAPATAEELESITHTVEAGQHLASIARRYAISEELIIAANNITDPNRILVGQQLIIPTSVTPEQLEAIVYAAPGAKINQGREIVVDLSNSRVYAYENGMLMYEAVSSNGLPATPTVQGQFGVVSKVRSQTMSGPGYYLPNVEWVMYFYQGYALHGAYWHNNFGQPMSHGCVNLTNTDAQWFYNFAEIGTPVTVQY